MFQGTNPQRINARFVVPQQITNIRYQETRGRIKKSFITTIWYRRSFDYPQPKSFKLFRLVEKHGRQGGMASVSYVNIGKTLNKTTRPSKGDN